MTPQELDAIEARANAATPMPWYVEKLPYPELGLTTGGVFAADGAQIIETDAGVYPPSQEDAAFIAAARSDVPALVAEVRRLGRLLK